MENIIGMACAINIGLTCGKIIGVTQLNYWGGMALMSDHPVSTALVQNIQRISIRMIDCNPDGTGGTNAFLKQNAI